MSSPYSGGQFPGQVIFAVDGDHTVAAAIGPPKISFPFEGDSHAPNVYQVVRVLATNQSGYKYAFEYLGANQDNVCGENFIIEQDFQVAADFFSPLPLNTPYDQFSYAPDYQGNLILALAILVGESPTSEAGAGLVRFTRTYSVIPWPRSTYESHNFSFPATAPVSVGVPNAFDINQLPVGFDVTILLGGSRQIDTEIVVRVERSFFVLSNGGGGFPAPFSPEFNDPTSPWFIYRKFRVFYGTFVNEVGQVFGRDWEISFENVDGSAFDPTTQPHNTIPPLITGDAGNDADSGEGYLNMIAAGAEICVRESQIRPWRGNIYEKITLWAAAQ